MKSVLDISVSAFSNYHSTSPKDVNLLTWLYSDKYADKVLAIRELSDKKERDKIKATLPAITPGGTFSERRATGLINHSGLLQFDVDGVQDIKTTKQKICSLPNVAYCGLSVSGRGLWGLIPIVEPEHHKKYFEFIQKAFASMGICIDEACKDVSRLRGYSYDPEAYFNHDAKPLNKFYSRPKAVYPKTHFKGNTGDFETERIEYCINEISARKIDITARYNDWFALGCSFASLGEQGRQYFHAVSQNYPGYDPQETDEQFTKCLKSTIKDLSTFFGKCRNAGVRFKDAAPITESAHPEPQQTVKNIEFPQWYLLHVEALKKRIRNEISDKDFCKRMEQISKSEGLGVSEYVDRVNECDKLYFKNQSL